MEQRTPDQLVEWAYDQFLEQAADMLAPEQIVDITLEFEQRGAVEATLPNADWSTELGELLTENQVHVRWHRQQQA